MVKNDGFILNLITFKFFEDFTMNRKLSSIKILFVLGVWLFSLGTVFASASNQTEVKKAYYDWCSNISLAKGNPQEMVKFYEPNNAVVYPINSSILTPPNSPKILYSRKGGLYGYFAFLTGLPNIKCTTNKLVTQINGDEIMNTGLYTFSYTDSSGKTKKIRANFTFTYKKFNNQYLITKQRSSVLH